MATKLTTCICCGSKKLHSYSKGLSQCSNCLLVAASEIPTFAEVENLYQENYFFGMEYFDYKADRPALEHNFKKRINRLGFMIQPNFSIVEIGCAYGYFLALVKKSVKHHIGFDVSQAGITYAKKELGVQVTTNNFLTHKIKPSSIDSLFMWDLIEHLSFPDTYIKRVSEVLKTGGHIAITTGNIDSWLARKRRGAWRMIHPPTHVYYFSPHTLGLLLNKHGLKIISIKHKAVSRNVGSIINQILARRKALGRPTTHISIFSKAAELLRADKLNIPLNTRDIMEVVAVKYTS